MPPLRREAKLLITECRNILIEICDHLLLHTRRFPLALRSSQQRPAIPFRLLPHNVIHAVHLSLFTSALLNLIASDHRIREADE